jgi:signal transduction histidine kinase/ActR/RegA family two-component response regulator
MGLVFINRDLTTQTWPYVYERTRPDGTVFEVTFNPMAIGGYVATYADVTERHRAARALKTTNEMLEQRVLERTLALEEAKTAAERANASKTRFLAAASHDLLQPLSAARLFVSALQENLRGRDQRGDNASSAIGFTDNALAALQSTERLLSELLYISSLDSRTLRPEIRHFGIGEMMAQLEVEFSALAAQRGLTLRVVISRAIVETDPALLRRILQNFLSNAIRYTQQGRILLGARRRADKIRIEVWDTGVGIAENMRREIFQEFRRLPQDVPNAEKGFGLGLAIVERIGRLLDLRVFVESHPGRGSMFAIEAPRSPSMEAEPALESPPLPKFQNAGRLSILCVDNDESILEGMTALLEQWGHSIVSARTFDEALSRQGDGAPDVVLIDYHLDAPSNGLDVLTQLRKHWGQDARAMLITADRTEQVAACAKEAQCDILHKPVKPAALRRYLNSVTLQAADRQASARGGDNLRR